jgi:hypothetical protein
MSRPPIEGSHFMKTGEYGHKYHYYPAYLLGF